MIVQESIKSGNENTLNFAVDFVLVVGHHARCGCRNHSAGKRKLSKIKTFAFQCYSTLYLIVRSRAPKPVSSATADPIRTFETKWTKLRFPLGKFLNWAVALTWTLFMFMLKFPFPSTGAWTPINCAEVEWNPRMFIVGMLRSNLMIKPAIDKSKKEKHILCWPVTSAFLNVKSTLKF